MFSGYTYDKHLYPSEGEFRQAALDNDCTIEEAKQAYQKYMRSFKTKQQHTPSRLLTLRLRLWKFRDRMTTTCPVCDKRVIHHPVIMQRHMRKSPRCYQALIRLADYLKMTLAEQLCTMPLWTWGWETRLSPPVRLCGVRINNEYINETVGEN